MGSYVGPGPFWTGAENLAHSGIPSSDRPARSELLYRLSYLGPQKIHTKTNKYHFCLLKFMKLWSMSLTKYMSHNLYYFPFILQISGYNSSPFYATNRVCVSLSMYYYRGADKSLDWPDWKNNWKVTIFRLTKRSLLPRRSGWTDKFLIFFFLSGFQKLEFGRCSLFPSWSG